MTTTPAYAHLACCIDDSAAARSGLSEARRLLESGAAGRVTLVHVVPPPPLRDVIVGTVATAFGGTPLQEDYEAEHEEARLWLETVGAGLPAAERVLLVSGGDDSPAGEVCKWAEANSVDLLLTGVHSGALERLGLEIGSFSKHLAHHGPCPVLMVRPEPAPAPEEAPQA